VKNNQSTALFNANSAAAEAKIKRIVSGLPQISLTIESSLTKYITTAAYNGQVKLIN
jgi:hypothetical protein